MIAKTPKWTNKNLTDIYILSAWEFVELCFGRYALSSDFQKVYAVHLSLQSSERLPWFSLWPSTSGEIPRLKEKARVKDSLETARESFIWKFLHYFATLWSHQRRCKIWLVDTWKVWDLSVSCGCSDFTSPERGGKDWTACVKFVLKGEHIVCYRELPGGIVVFRHYFLSFHPKWVYLAVHLWKQSTVQGQL